MSGKGRVVKALVMIVLVSATYECDRLEAKTDPATAIRAMLDEQVRAWNRGDLEGYMQGYWNSSDLTFYSGGTKTAGWTPTLERYRKRYQEGGSKMGKLIFTEVQVELLGSSTGLVKGRWQLRLGSGDIGGLFTLIVRRFKEGWRIVHDHTSASS